MLSSKKKTNRYIAMWDMTGLECLINVTTIQKQHEKWEKENLFRILKDQTRPLKPANVPLDMMILRARYNSQRHYEIYTFDSELSEKYIKQTFESDPQVMVDVIRNVGHELYSDRVLKKTQVIT